MNIKYTGNNIVDACKEVGAEITEELSNLQKTKSLGGCNNPPSYLYVCLLSGAVPFFSELTKYVPMGQLAYVRASSYGNGRVSGELNLDISTLPPADTKFDAVIVIDDICDTGKTLQGTINALEDYFEHPSFYYTAVMINKSTEGRHAPDLVDFAGFDDASTDFYAGFGLDNQGLDRNLNYIYICE